MNHFPAVKGLSGESPANCCRPMPPDGSIGGIAVGYWMLCVWQAKESLVPRRSIYLAALVLSLSAAAFAQDAVVSSNRRLEGRVTQITATEVQVSAAGVSQTVPVNQISSIIFQHDPAGMKLARGQIVAGNYDQALKSLEQVNLDEVSQAEVKQEVEFQRAFCAAKLALTGQVEIAKAGGDLVNFVKANPASWHVWEANELIGDLLMLGGKPAMAKDYYERIAAAPWPEFKMRSAVAVGNALLADQKAAEAMKAFESVLQSPGEGAPQMAARLGKARCLIASGQTDQAVQLADAVIAKAAPEDSPLLAKAYLAKGVALKQAKKPQDAVFSLLRVDTMYSDDKASHAEALYHLVQLWQELRQPQRSLDARRTLENQYKDSLWCRSLGQ